MRAAKNETSFREANELLEAKRDDLGVGEPTPFLCECGYPDCTDLVLLSPAEYEHVRSRPNWFLISVRHHGGDERTVEEYDDYVIVEKHGLAGRIAEEEDQRG